MSKQRLTRRQFFQVSAFGAGALALPALGLASVAAAPSRAAQAASEQPLGPDLPQPTFNSIASNTTFGPLTDISMGWDGTVWGIDAQGAPHVYDPINDVFAQHGDGIDAAAQMGDLVYFFFGNQVLYITKSQQYSASTPVPIGTQWTTLPDSFKLGVVGAANYNDKGLILFNGGRFVSTDGSIPLTSLTSLTNWPQTPAWKDGVVDTVYATDVGQDIILIRSGQFISVNPVTKAVTAQPQPLSANSLFSAYLPSSWLSSGFDAMTVAGDNYSWAFKGTAGKVFQNGGVNGAPAYLPALFPKWPATWHPTLAHAPNGRDGNLWSVLPGTQGSYIVQHDGDAWSVRGEQADHVGVGQDNTVMLASAQKLWKFNGAGFDAVSQPSNLVQVSLGNSNSVYARDTSNNVYSFNLGTGALTPNTVAPTAIHIAAANDGSLWHAKPGTNNSGDPNMHRYLSGPNVVDAIPVKNGVVSTVTKVAATGFGAAHCLVQETSGPTSTTPATGLYRYDTPFVFKTAGSYFSTGKHIEEGLGRLYMTVEDTDPTISGPTQNYSAVLAIDAHTGKELARTPNPGPSFIFTTPVFDRVHNLVFVGMAPFDPRVLDQPGKVVALDPVTLTVKWVFDADKGVDVVPTLIQNDLYFADRGAKIYKVDIAAAIANPVNIQPVWTAVPPLNAPPPYAVPNGWGNLRGVSQFAFYEDSLYCTVWDIGYGCHWDNGNPFEPKGADWISQTAGFVQIKVADGTLSVRNPPEPIPAGQPMAIVNGPIAFGVEKLYAFPPLFINLQAPTSDDPYRTVPALFVNGGFSVFIYVLSFGNPDPRFDDGGFAVGRYDLPGGLDPNVGIVYTADMVTTGFAYDDGKRASASQNVTPSVWFGAMGDPINGSTAPLLFSVNTQLKVQDGTPYKVTDQPYTLIRTTPVMYKDSTNDLTVFFGLSDAGNAWFPSPNPDSPALVGLYGYSPTTGNQASLETGTTQLTVLSRAPSSGVIYGTGSKITGTEFAQVFGIRVDQLVQDERDFIIESALIQDFDKNSPDSYRDPNNPKVGAIPPSVARYKAHITVVDSNKKPRPNEPVKVWCDTPGTVITVDNTQYTVGPDDDQFALVKTGVDGVLVLATDAGDINAPEFRVWAAFMDPSERIIVFVDQEWHNQMTNATNNYNDDGKNPDPRAPNLSTVRNYRGEPLYDSDDKADDTPGKVANSIAQMKAGTNTGQASTAALARSLKTLHASNSAASYVAYADLPGMHYAPTNALAKRPANAGGPMGFQFSRDPVTKKSTYTPMTHDVARNTMDAVTQGVPRWDPDNPGVVAARRPQGATAVLSKRKNGFQKLWDWIKQGLAAIENVLVSVTDEILTTISMILPDGARQVFQFVAQAIEDVVAVIGMIINMFETAVDDFIAAIGLNYFFDEWFNTQDWLTTQVNYLATELANYMISDIKPIIDANIENAEAKVKCAFDQIKAEFAGQSITNLQGANTTPHTAYTVGSPPSSQAVQCSDVTQTLKSNLGSASPISSPTSATVKRVELPNRPEGDPITDFFNGFIQSLTTDPVLSQSISDLKSDASNLFSSSSLNNFFTNFMETLLDIIELLVVGAMAVCKAFLDGLFAAIVDVINALITAVNAEIDIPVISDLYQFLFDQPMTILNIGTLIAALVVNIVYRIGWGKYPSQAGALSQDIVRTTSSTPTPPPPYVCPSTTANGKRVVMSSLAPAGRMQVATAASPVARLVIGIINGVLQLVYAVVNAVSDAEGEDAPAFLSKLSSFLSIAMASLSAPWITSDDPDESTQLIWGFDCMAPALATIIGLYPGSDQSAGPYLYAIFGLVGLIITIVEYTQITNPKTSDKLNLAIGVCSSVPELVNPAKALEPYGPVVVAVIDVLGYGIAGGCMIAEAIVLYKDPNSAVLRVHRLHFPFVAAHPTTMHAHPRTLALAGATP